MDYNEDTIRFENTLDGRAGVARAAGSRPTIPAAVDQAMESVDKLNKAFNELQERIGFVLRPSESRTEALNREVDPDTGSDMMNQVKMLQSRLEQLIFRVYETTQRVDL